MIFKYLIFYFRYFHVPSHYFFFTYIIDRNAILFGTSAYIPHITIKSGLTKNGAQMVANRYKIIKPNFEIHGTVVQTHTKVVQGICLVDFYALEQHLKINGFESKVHIPLAYRNHPFTDMEIAIANMSLPFIKTTEYYVAVADCRYTQDKWCLIDTI